jgi:4a-hydroxytetrahydrobiopterin dehydratase
MEDLAQMHCSAITGSTPRLAESEVQRLAKELPEGWRMFEKDGEARLEKTYKFENFDQALAFTNRVAQAAIHEDHHPALLTEWGKVTVTWWTHKIKGLHLNDFIMASQTERLYSKTPVR